jgi:hypothetical protein
MRRLFAIEGCDVNQGVDSLGLFLEWTAKMAVDTDGSGPLHGDPDAQKDTSLHVNGKPLNADVDRYIVVPPAIIQVVEGIVLGCHAVVTNTLNNKTTDAVVGDVGPAKKLGEASVATAAAVGVDPSPTRGGIEAHVIRYRIYPGMAARGYRLQPWHR